VGRGPAAPEIVVVHAGQIVMHQRIGVQHLDRGCGTQRPRVVDAEQPRAMLHQERAQPLAARERRIAHRIVDSGMQTVRLGQDGVQHRLDGLGGAGHRGEKAAMRIGRGWCGV
jgi:hypothetical protein